MPNRTTVMPDRSGFSVATDVFNLMPGLVIEVTGMLGIITEVSRNCGREEITFTVNTPGGDLTFVRSWAEGHYVRIVGLAVDCDPGNIDLFDN